MKTKGVITFLIGMIALTGCGADATVSNEKDYSGEIAPAAETAEAVPNSVRHLGYITSLDDEKITLDEVEWITEDMTDRIEDLGLNITADLPGGFYIYNESDKELVFTVSEECSVQINNYDTEYQTVDLTYEQFKDKFLSGEYEIDRLSEGLYWIEYRNGKAVSITQQYVP